MYADFFGLREQPFNNTHDPRYFYSTPEYEEALASLIYTVGEKKGFTLLTGEAGTGKTLLTRLMLSHFGPRVAFAELGTTPLTPENALASLCTELGVDIEFSEDVAQTIRALQSYLLERFAQNKPVVVTVDDAHCLPVQTLEQLRFVANIESSDSMLIQVILVGQPELCATMDDPKLRPLAQRCFRACHLPRLTRAQVGAYMQHRLKIAGGDHLELFDTASTDAIYELSGGIPRMINTVCDNVLLSAYAGDSKQIDANFVRSVASNTMRLQVAPAARSTRGAASAVVEEVPRVTPAPDVGSAVTSPPPEKPKRRQPTSILEQLTPSTSSNDFEWKLSRQMASLECRVADLVHHQPEGPSDTHAWLATRLGDMEQKLEQMRTQHDAVSRQSEAHVREASAKLEAQIASTKAMADEAISRIKDQSRKAKELASAVASSNLQRHAAAQRPVGRLDDVRRAAERLDQSADALRAAPREASGFAEASQDAIEVERRIDLLRKRMDSAFAHSAPTQSLLQNVRGLTRLADSVNTNAVEGTDPDAENSD